MSRRRTTSSTARRRRYGTQTGPTAAGSGTATSNASAAVVGLTPNTTYHYRIVAVNAAGTTLGGDQAFKTPKQPLGLSLLANAEPGAVRRLDDDQRRR